MPPKRKRAARTPIEIANEKSDANFIEEYLNLGKQHSTWIHPRTSKLYRLELIGASRMSTEDMHACYKLIEHTSRADYENSSSGWRPRHKTKEMKSPELRYLLVRSYPACPKKGAADKAVNIEDEECNERGFVEGFASMMPTYEDGDPVLYCYEIHLGDELLGTGLGFQLMSHLVAVATKIPSIEKVMLSCFVNNFRARGFYKKMGFVKDPYSPGPRLLRGKTVEPDYEILSLQVPNTSNRELVRGDRAQEDRKL